MVTQAAPEVPSNLLRRPVASLAEERYVVSDALDMLLHGH